MNRRIGFLSVVTLGLFLAGAGTARADSFITAAINNAAFGNGPIQFWQLDVTTGTATAAGSFIPTGAAGGNNGRAIAVTNTETYYTELLGGFGATPSIETAPTNGGSGGPDNGSIANPTPGQGIAGLHFGSGVNGGDLYVMAGYPNTQPEVVEFNPNNGVIVAGPVLLASPVADDSDGFTILPNGNFLVNSGDADNSYNQYNPLTGALVPGTTISAPGCAEATGVDTNGTDLFFDCNFNSIVETTLAGALVNTFTLPGAYGEGEGLSLVQNFNPPPPNATPEPTSLLLLGTGLVGLVRRRRAESKGRAS